MKRVLFVFAIVFAMVACKNEKKEVKETVSTEAATEVTTAEPTSYVWWKGDKVVSGSHNGKIEFSKVDLNTADNKLVGGEIVVDMKTMTTDDLSGKKAENLIGHLSNEDFFEVEKYPTATFKILEVEHPADGGPAGHKVTGSLTIKDVTKNITVPASVSVNDGKVKFESEFTIDRSEYNVNYGSPTKVVDIAKDKAIKDEVELKVIIAQ